MDDVLVVRGSSRSCTIFLSSKINKTAKNLKILLKIMSLKYKLTYSFQHLEYKNKYPFFVKPPAVKGLGGSLSDVLYYS